MRMTIEDNGTFTLLSAKDNSHGLKSMEARIRGLNGNFSIKKTVLGGTLVECLVPLTEISDAVLN
jgi:signal transduction histidine kinase